MDAERLAACAYPDVESILAHLKHEHGFTLAIASRGWFPYLTYRNLEMLGWLQYFDYCEIFSSGPRRPMNVSHPADKALHFARLKEKSGFDYNQMYFFDDDERWVRQADEWLGASICTYEDGLQWAHVAKLGKIIGVEGLAKPRSHRSPSKPKAAAVFEA